jgi:glycine cleavage system aminomethyltransferase T
VRDFAGKRRRTGASANFLGAKPILDQLAAKSWTKRRVGLGVQDKAPARRKYVGFGCVLAHDVSFVVPGVMAAGTQIFDKSGNQIGVVTSGTVSPWCVPWIDCWFCDALSLEAGSDNRGLSVVQLEAPYCNGLRQQGLP